MVDEYGEGPGQAAMRDVAALRAVERSMPRWSSFDDLEYSTTFDAAAYDAWTAEQTMLAAYGNLLLVSGSHLQDLAQKHENARVRRVFRRWAWKHAMKRGAPPRPQET